MTTKTMTKLYRSILNINMAEESSVEFRLGRIDETEITGFVSISLFSSLVCFPVRIASHAVGIKTCGIAAWIENYQSIIKKKQKEHDKIVLLGKIS